MSHTTIGPRDVLHTARQHPWLVIAPVIVVTAVAALYAVVRPRTWEAAQALIVRDETGDSLSRTGTFAHLEDMKTTQETILELARSRSVLVNALREVGPASDSNSTSKWPDERALESLQGHVKVVPPSGAEFGKTEVFYLKVQDESQERAVKLAAAICSQLQQRLGACAPTRPAAPATN